MALIHCPECNEQISDKALACPKCGHPRMSQLMGWRALGFEWKTKEEVFGWPLIHIAVGFDKKTGRLAVARGIIAIGQFGIGVITLAQFGVGLLFGLGQFVAGFCVIGQFAFGIFFGLGQIATGMTAIGQFGFGQYVRAMAGIGQHLWTMKIKDPEAVEHFRKFFDVLKLHAG
ncbi:MAG: zinc ribbon domain-containing protein [Candidatus Omnitrophica bacterium]|nr:zinc ribbon domain-containing protein [Candidatus Omnitrophota bacterium]